MIAELMPSLRFKEFTQEFELSKLEDIVQKKISYGIVQAGPHVEGGMPYIKSKNLNNELRVIDLDRTSTEIAKKYKRSEVGPGDIVFSLRGNIGVSRIVPDSVSVANLTQGTARLSLKAGFSAKYIQEELRTSRVKNRIEAISKGSTFQEISLTDLRTVKVAIPEKAEQQKIANFLASVDTKISQLTEKHRLLKDYKKGVMQQIFSQQIRFKDDDGNAFPDWQVKPLTEYIIKHDEKSDFSDQYPVLTSSRKGLFFQKDYYKGQVASENNTGYNVVPRGYFTYRHMSDDLVFKFNINHLCDKGIVSTLYPVFTTQNILDEFLMLTLNEGDEFKRFALLQKQGGSRTYMYLSKLMNLEVSSPSLKEQAKICKFLSSLDKKIDAVNEQIEHTKLFKKGLLQQMFV